MLLEPAIQKENARRERVRAVRERATRVVATRNYPAPVIAKMLGDLQLPHVPGLVSRLAKGRVLTATQFYGIHTTAGLTLA